MRCLSPSPAALIKTGNLEKHQEMRFDTHKTFPIEFGLVSFFKPCLQLEQTRGTDDWRDGQTVRGVGLVSYNIPIIISMTKTYINIKPTHIRLHGKARKQRPTNVNLFCFNNILKCNNIQCERDMTKPGSFHYN